jgi:hypothetical protein
MADEVRKPSLVKPTLDTLFHIDFDWWQENDSNWRIFLRSFLCPHHQEAFAAEDEDIRIDAVDPETAEVKAVDGILHTLVTHCAREEDFLSANVPLIAKLLRVFLSNGNQPLSPKQLSAMVGRPAMTILVTLTGPQVYKGIRPLQEQ